MVSSHCFCNAAAPSQMVVPQRSHRDLKFEKRNMRAGRDKHFTVIVWAVDEQITQINMTNSIQHKQSNNAVCKRICKLPKRNRGGWPLESYKTCPHRVGGWRRSHPGMRRSMRETPQPTDAAQKTQLRAPWGESLLRDRAKASAATSSSSDEESESDATTSVPRCPCAVDAPAHASFMPDASAMMRHGYGFAAMQAEVNCVTA